jgi:D-psicose/D-tagatose/L-ribulose 3-epimerase
VKIGMNLLLWTGHVDHEHVEIFKALKATGFDGVELPLFDVGSTDHYAKLGRILDDIGLERTAITIIPDAWHSPISDNPAHRAAATVHLQRAVACTQALGASVLAGPFFQPLGIFSGERPSEIELDHCASVHQTIMPMLRDAGILCAIEPLNRFEAHLLNSCDQALHYLSRVGDPQMGILYDSFHANIEEKDPIAALRRVHAAGALHHVHISENDRGTPGRGHAKLAETIAVLRELDYRGWLTIEAFGRAVPELAAATRVWRDFFPDPAQVYTEGYHYIRNAWDVSS